MKGISFIIKYIYSLIGAELSTTTRFCDQCAQVTPLPHDRGLFFERVECNKKTVAASLEEVEEHRDRKDVRITLLLNGNFNYSTDIEGELRQLRPKLSRHSRLLVVIYNPFMKSLYKLADWLGLRNAPMPDTFITPDELYNIARLAGYEMVRARPTVFFPLPIPLLSTLLNKVLPIIPLVRRLSLVWVVALRPVIAEQRNPSLSIIIPARNEAGNIADAIERIPRFADTDVEVIFVEGNSSDDTWERVLEQTRRTDAPFAIKAFQQSGKGKFDAVRLGFAEASKEIVTILDADLTMPPELLSRFYDAYCQGLGDFINGNRLLYPMEKDAMRPLNRLGNFFFAKQLAWILGLKISDSLCGTKMFPRRDYQRQVEWRDRFGDFDPFGDFEMLFAASELALGVQDVPIRYRARAYGETQISRFRDGVKLKRMAVIGFLRILLGKAR